MSALEQDITKKRRTEENATKFDAGNNNSGEYKVKVIWDSVIYIRKSISSHLPGFYYLVSLKRYPEEKNIYESASAVQYFKKLISLFHKDHSDKPITMSSAIKTILSRTKPTVKHTKPAKQIQR